MLSTSILSAIAQQARDLHAEMSSQATSELIVTPAGVLHLLRGDDATTSGGWMKRVAAGFLSGPGAGLFALAATKPDASQSPAFTYWRDFACRYLTQLCRMPGSVRGNIDAIEPPFHADLAAILLSVPPMQGAEYMNVEVLGRLWGELDTWVRNEIAESDTDLAAWLKKHAPVWRQVGRVCFHLAENKRDSRFPFAFLATYAPSLSRTGRVQYKPLGKALQEYAGERNKEALINLLSPVHEASKKVDFVKDLIDSGDIFHPLAWTPDEAYQLLRSTILLEESGLLVRLPDWWQKRLRPRVTVTIGENRQNRFGVEAMLDFRVGLTLGDQELSEKEWKQILSSVDGLAFVKGQWIEVDREKLSMALEHWKRVEAGTTGEGISFIEGMRLLAGAHADLSADGSIEDSDREWSFVDAGSWLAEVLAGLHNPDGLGTSSTTINGRTLVEAGDDFQGTLRHYQEIGHNWLWLLTRLGLGACLADDMGLGKTVQVISLLVTLRQNAPAAGISLLVLPASLLANWKAELKRFAPTMKALFIHPSEADRSFLSNIAENPQEMLLETDIVLTTYGMLSSQEWLLDIQWRLVILDEAQAIKNPATRQTKTVKQLKAGARIALTGTPVENRLSDLWSLFDFLCPGLLGSSVKFKQFVKGLEAREHDRYAPLRNLIQPYILRRLKTDKSIITDLPNKTEMKAFCGLSKHQIALYTRVVKNLASALENLEGIKRRGLVLASLMKLKQICNHPSQFLGDGEYKPDHSRKFDRLQEICDEIMSRQEKVLVFTQFREIAEPIAAFLLHTFGRECLVLHGATAVGKRRSLIERFQMEDGPPFFVLSLKAGGTGLNLTAASHVIHFDRWWNPAVENQATDRAFRIGQNRNVVVHKFVCRGTVEEKIDALIEEKTDLADQILKSGSESLLTEMNNEELIKTVTLDLDRATI